MVNMKFLMQLEKNLFVQVSITPICMARLVCFCLYLDISSPGAIKKVLPENYTYGEIKLTIAVMSVTTGFVRPLSVKKTTHPQSACTVNILVMAYIADSPLAGKC